VDDKPITLQVWDTAGQEMYRALVPVYLRGAQGAILVYDVAEVTSFQALPHWTGVITETLSPETVLFLAANKIDLEAEFAVDWDAGTGFAVSNKATFFKVSALTGEGVFELFQAMAAEMAKRNREGLEPKRLQKLQPEEKACSC
jgi:small GTP-binding protein